MFKTILICVMIFIFCSTMFWVLLTRIQKEESPGEIFLVIQTDQSSYSIVNFTTPFDIDGSNIFIIEKGNLVKYIKYNRILNDDERQRVREDIKETYKLKEKKDAENKNINFYVIKSNYKHISFYCRNEEKNK